MYNKLYIFPNISIYYYYCALLHYTPQVDVGKRAFQSEDAVEEEDEDREASPKAVGHNIFILAKQVNCQPKHLHPS